MTLRSILLRYGTSFSPNQWKAIMNDSILPSIELAAKNDTSQVMKIISESPTVSNLEFLTEPLSLPPTVYDEGLIKFAEESKLDGSQNTSHKLMGHAELLVEASFVDLKHGGDGDLSKAYTLPTSICREGIPSHSITGAISCRSKAAKDSITPTARTEPGKA